MRGRRTVGSAAIGFAMGSLVAASGCGDGGSASGDENTASLSIRAHWEQPAAAARGQASRQASAANRSSARTVRLPGRADAFGTPIPAAVNTVRITLVPGDGSAAAACCVAIPRGSAAFTERRLVLGALPAGDVLVQISGYPDTFAPADGIGAQCITFPLGAGAACEGGRALPSFASNDVPVTVVAGEQASTGDVPIPSRPFLVDLRPAEGTVAAQARVPISFSVVSANTPVAINSIAIALEAGAQQPFSAPIRTRTPCDERPLADAPRRTRGADLDVSGFLVDALSEALPAGPAHITISAQDTAGRDLTFDYDFVVQPGASTTTSSSTTTTTSPTTTTLPTTTTSMTSTTVTTLTTSTSTTTTTLPATTTTTTSTTTTTNTLPAQFACTLIFDVSSGETLERLTWDTDYNAAQGRFENPAEGPRCQSTRPETVLVFSGDNPVNRLMNVGVRSAVGWSNPGDAAICKFLTADPSLAPSQFASTVTGANLAGGGPANPAFGMALDCVALGTTTTTTLPASFDTCDVTFGYPTSDVLSALQFDVGYSLTGGGFQGFGSFANCLALVDSPGWEDKESAKTLSVLMTDPTGVPGPADVVRCLYRGPTPASDSFIINTLAARDPSGNPTNAFVQVTNLVCGL